MNKSSNMNVILNFAKGGNYPSGQKRLVTSCRHKGYTGDFLTYTDEKQLNCPPHSLNPYAFKTYAFRDAFIKKYTHALWLDASVYAVENPMLAFDIIKEDGYLMQYSGHLAGDWANDKCLEYFNISRDEAYKIPMYGNAGMLGLDMSKDINIVFLKLWDKAMKNGIFKGAWNNDKLTESKDARCKGHRHDMVVGSIIAHQLGFKHNAGGDEVLQYKAPTDPKANDTIIFGAQGI